MSRGRWAMGVVGLAVLLAVAAWLLLPRLPGRARQYLPEPLAGLGVAPLPTALPAPVAEVAVGAELALLGETTEERRPTAAAEGATTDDGRPTTAAGEAATTAPTPTLAATQTPAPTVVPLPAFARLDGVPIIPQKFNNCGPTNLTQVLNFYGVDVDQFDVAGVVRPNYEDRNVSPGELAAYVNNHTGLRAEAYVGGDVDTLRRLLAAGFPVIVEKGLTPDEATGWMGHYLTLFGYDDEARHFYARDTFLGPWEEDGLVDYDATARDWAAFNGAFVVVFPPEQASALPESLGPAFADTATMWMAAAEKAREALRRRPDAFAWFNLGASLTALAADDPALYRDAALAFDRARLAGLPPRMLWYQFAPYEAYLAAGRPDDVLALAEATLAGQGGRNVEETYYYQGLAYRALGDEAAARAAFSRAAELNPVSPVGLAATAALRGGTMGDGG